MSASDAVGTGVGCLVGSALVVVPIWYFAGSVWGMRAGVVMLGLLVLVVLQSMVSGIRSEQRRREADAREQAARARQLARKAELIEQFGLEVAERILARTLWVGATEEMVQLMFGEPEQSNEKVSRNRVIKTWKYAQRGKRIFDLVIELENGAVRGWTDKR